MKRIAIVTATRAEYGLLTPLIKRISDDKELEPELIVTGIHLLDKYGHTIDDIIEDGFSISHEISILDDDNSAYGISLTMANAIKGFAKCFRDDRPDMVVILGDRTEMLGVASAAMNERILIAHIHGGEVTEGAVDDCVRHSITKMSYLHFTCTEDYRKRVIQLGENPDRVYNVGSLGAENILNRKLLSFRELQEHTPELLCREDDKYAVVTYHPTTLETMSVENQLRELCVAMEKKKEIFFLITASNADAGGDEANEILKDYVRMHSNAAYVYSLGANRYLSAVKNACFVLGNSSSGILEAPILGTPSVNIGDRQKGRIQPETVKNCGINYEEIIDAIDKALATEKKKTDIYGDGTASQQMLNVIKNTLMSDNIELKKGFHDLVI